MNLYNRLKLWCAIGIGIFLLCGCAALSPAPKVDVGYLETESGSSIPAAFVDYAPGMTFSVQYSPKVEDITARHSYYTETISYASGKKTEIEFFVTRVNPNEYEVSINGKVKKVPTYQEYTENVAPALEEKISFALLPGGFGAPLMKVPQMCPSAIELTKEYSPIASNQFLNSLDRIILKCAETGKAHYLTFSYVRENTSDSLIQSYKVKIEETALTDPTPAKEEAASGPSVPEVNSKLPKAGHWEGTGPSVSFDVTSTGEIVNFRLSAPFITSNCVITLERVPVMDNKFTLDAKTADKATASIGIFVIDGQFRGEEISGTHKIEMCGRTVALQPETRQWRAAWVGDMVSSLPSPTPLVVAAITEPPTNPPAPTATTETVVEPSGVYLAEYKPTTYSLGYGTYSVGTFAFSSEDPADNIHKGEPIILNDVEYSHAIFAHAPSRMVFDLGEAAGFAELNASVGMVKHIECGDGVTFIVIGDGAEIFRSNTIFAWTPPTRIQVPIQGVRMLTLLTDEGPQNDMACDWAIWGDPILR